MKRWPLSAIIIIVFVTACQSALTSNKLTRSQEKETTDAKTITRTTTDLPSMMPTDISTPTRAPTIFRRPTQNKNNYFLDLGISLLLPARPYDGFGNLQIDQPGVYCWNWPVDVRRLREYKGMLCVEYPETDLPFSEYILWFQATIQKEFPSAEVISDNEFTTTGGVKGRKVTYTYTGKDKVDYFCAFYLFSNEWRGILQFVFCRDAGWRRTVEQGEYVDDYLDQAIKTLRWTFPMDFIQNVPEAGR